MKSFLRLSAAILLLLASISAGAQDTSSQESRKSRLEREIQIIERQLKDNSAKNSSALTKLSLLRQKQEGRRALIKESEKEILALDDSISVVRKQADALQARLDTMTLYYEKLVRNAYKNRDAKIWYMYILSSRNIGQAGRRYSYLKSLSGQMNVQARKIKDTKSELDRKLEGLKVMRSRAESLKAARQKELKKLQDEEASGKKLVAQLGKEKTKYQNQLKAKKKQVEALNREIEKLISASISEGGTKNRKKQSKPIDYKLSGEFQNNKGKLPWPAYGPVAEHFGRHFHPVFTKLEMPFNNGVNISLAGGSEVHCIYNGEVKRVIVMPGYNKCVLVQHGEYFTFYCKLGSVSVKAGDKLKTGQTVGIVDTIDGQTQLHFELWKGRTPQDPELWLRPKD